MFKPKVSIIIPVYNGSNYLRQAIDSVLAQTYQNYEILVVNDGSCDKGRTEEIALSYKDKIRYFYKENGGVSTALNLGIKQMCGEYFLWLSHDDVLKVDALENFMKCMQDVSPETIIFGNYDLIDESNSVYNSFDLEAIYSKERLEMSVFPVINGVVNACVTLVHKSHFKRVGMFNERLRITQDNEMWFRMFRSQKTYFCKEILGSKRYHQEQDSATKNVYHDEDEFVYQSIKRLTLLEICEFEGTSYMFYKKFRDSFNDGRHPQVIQFCHERLEELNLKNLCNEYNKEELITIIQHMNKASEKLCMEVSELRRKYQQNLMKF